MIGFIIAATLVVLKIILDTTSPELAIIQSSSFLFWWYLGTGVASITMALIAWAGALGTEGARMRFGIATPLSLMIGIYRMPLNNFWVLLYLLVRRAMMIGGAYLIVESFRGNAAGLVQDQMLLFAGLASILIGLLTGIFRPQVHSEHPGIRIREVPS